MSKEKSRLSFTKKLTESAVMLALTFVLSYFKLIDLPYGGSVTLCSMLPTIIIAYRYGMLWGFGSGLVNGILQLLMGMGNLAYATSATAAVAIIMLDYILAFSVTGLGGAFKKCIKNQTAALVTGTLLVCLLRYVFHVVAGCTVWAGLSIPDSAALFYSLAYNATYMLPELIIAVAGAFYISSAISLKGELLSRNASETATIGERALKIISVFGLLAAFITEVVIIAPSLQNAETGDFDITGIANLNGWTLLIVAVGGLAWFAIFRVLLAVKRKRKNR